jgi:hypothetical protein
MVHTSNLGCGGGITMHGKGFRPGTSLPCNFSNYTHTVDALDRSALANDV